MYIRINQQQCLLVNLSGSEENLNLELAEIEWLIQDFEFQYFDPGLLVLRRYLFKIDQDGKGIVLKIGKKVLRVPI
jgi:hypothetical protein